MSRRHDTIEALEKRRAAWAAEIGTRSEYAASAPGIVAHLDQEIAALNTKETDRGEWQEQSPNAFNTNAFGKPPA